MVYNFYFFQANNLVVEEILKEALALVEEMVDLVEEMVVLAEAMMGLVQKMVVSVEEIVEEIEVFVRQLHFLEHEKNKDIIYEKFSSIEIILLFL